MDTNLEEFRNKVKTFFVELDNCKDFSETRKLWLKTNIPYSFTILDPFSRMYKNKVLEIYNEITGIKYKEDNEFTSDKFIGEDFLKGHPFSSGFTYEVAASYAQIVQALKAVDLQKGEEAIEFGAGWGNLTEFLARTGINVTAIDIDPGLTERLKNKLSSQNLKAKVITSSYENSFDKLKDKYKAIIFHQSFHHSLDFIKLIEDIRNKILEPNGTIYFFSEPIFENYFVPWGLRTDGESIWAIGRNHWLELGFDKGFFAELLLKNLLFLQTIPEISGFVGNSYKATEATIETRFGDIFLPQKYNDTWWKADNTDTLSFRFSKELSLLPKLENNDGKTSYELTFFNASNETMKFKTYNEGKTQELSIDPSTTLTIKLKAEFSDIKITTSTWSPNEKLKNGDTRNIGIAITTIRIV